MSPRSGELFLNARINPSGFPTLQPGEAGSRLLDGFSLEYYVQRARLAERGLFASVFLADQPQLTADPARYPEYALEPLTLLSAVLTRVEGIGGVATASANFSLPYTLARQFATLNLMTRGRIGWNIVATFNQKVADNYGATIRSREDRYRRAAEFVEVVKTLWSSWRVDWRAEPDAGFDWGEIEDPEWAGEWFEVAGALNVPDAPWGSPVLVQAGGSLPGIELGAKYADLVYAEFHSRDHAREFRSTLRRKAAAFGRGPEEILVAPLLTPVLVSSEREKAERREEIITSFPDLEEQVRKLEVELGVRLTHIGLDRVLELDTLPTLENSEQVSVGIREGIRRRVDEAPTTIAELLTSRTGRFFGTPEEVSDRIATWWRDAAADGFTISTHAGTQDLADFVEHVVPLLQQAGVYGREARSGTLRERLGLVTA